ncbi:MAG: fructose-6-phosphate aldolase [Bdellovibrionales bacterium]|nr:fructose-6-phosphate aldolase [Bdellovibrionales bacterium]
MKFFLDTADLKEIEKAAATGLLDGVTTNPSLVAKTGMKFEQLIVRICELVDGPISAEVISTNAPGMIDEGRKLAAIHKNVVIKLPLTQEGLKACKTLSFEGKRTNVTLCFTPLQALMAAKAGATYISPFVGRLDDIGQDGMDLIQDIRTIYKNYGYKTEILVASVRHLEHLLTAAKMGADVATIPYKVFEQTLAHPLTESGLARFLKDWETSQKA